MRVQNSLIDCTLYELFDFALALDVVVMFNILNECGIQVDTYLCVLYVLVFPQMKVLQFSRSL